MKYTTIFTMITASVAVLGTSAAFADDPQLQSRLDMQRAQIESNQQAATVGAYFRGANRASRNENTIAFAGHRKSSGQANRGEQGWMEVTTPHGTVNYFTPAK
jgi:hypothetical protein